MRLSPIRSLVLGSCVAIAAFGCDSIPGCHRVGSTPQADTPPAPAMPVGPTMHLGAACDSLTRRQCLLARHCTLVAPRSGTASRYVCREARGPCETGLTQTVESRGECEDRESCAWSEGGCYCQCAGYGHTAVPDGDEAEPCDCECSGGPPPTCAAR